jgi:hypothetical protein
VLIGVIYLAAALTFPADFVMYNKGISVDDVLHPWVPYLCSVIGLVSGMIIAAFT